MKEKVKNGHNFNVDLSLPRKFWLYQSYGLRRPLATSFSISDLNMALAMFTKLLLGNRLENLFILTHISSEDIVFNSFLFVCYCFYLMCTLPQEWMVTISDYCYQAPTLWQPLPQVTCPSPALLQSDQLRPHRCVCTVIKNSSCSSEVLPNEHVKPRCQFFFLLLNRWIFIWNQLQNTTTKWSHTTARGTCRLLRPRQSWAPDETRTIFRCHTYMHTLTYSTL